MNGGFTDFSGNNVTEAEAKVHGQIQAFYFVKFLVRELPTFAWLAPILLGSCRFSKAAIYCLWLLVCNSPAHKIRGDIKMGIYKGDLLPGSEFCGWLLPVRVNLHLRWWSRYLVDLFQNAKHINTSDVKGNCVRSFQVSKDYR